MSAKGATLRGSDIVDLDFDDLTDLSAPRVSKSAMKDAVRSKPRMDLDASDVEFDERMASYKKPAAAPPVIPVAKTKSQSFVGKPAPTPPMPERPWEPLEGWEEKLDFKEDKEGNRIGMRPNVPNMSLILENDRVYKHALEFDVLSKCRTYRGEAIIDHHAALVIRDVHERYGVTFEASIVKFSMTHVAHLNPVNRVKAYLEHVGSNWDSVPRLQDMVTDFLGVEKNALYDEMLRKWMISCVARAYVPGCKVDNALVLYGAEGLRKSTFFKVLAGEWFSDTRMDLRSKDSYQQLQSAWVYEWGEIDNMATRQTPEDVKAFLSSTADNFRAPYAPNVENHQRSTVIVGTSNKPEFLVSSTGNRRFWVVPVAAKIDTDALRLWRDQLWGEAVAAFLDGESWHLSEKDEAKNAEANKSHAIIDPWDHAVASFLKHHRGPVYSELLLERALDLKTSEMDKAKLTRAGESIKAAGWKFAGRRMIKGVRYSLWFPGDVDVSGMTTADIERLMEVDGYVL